MKFHKFHHYPSTYVGFVVWGTAGFMGQPTLASFVVHFGLLPILLFGCLWLAHREGRKDVVNRR